MYGHSEGAKCHFDEKIHTSDVLTLIGLFRSGDWLHDKQWETVRLCLWILGCATHYAESRVLFGSHVHNGALTPEEQMDVLASEIESAIDSDGLAGDGFAGNTLSLSVVELCWMVLKDLEVFQ